MRGKKLLTFFLTGFLLSAILFSCQKTSSDAKKDFDQSIAQGGNRASSRIQGKPVFDPNHRVDFPLVFPIKGMDYKIINDVPESRLPNAPRTYRGANARHMGIDFYTGKCGLDVVSPADGWIIDLTEKEKFPDSKTRDAILKITDKAGITPLPILDNLYGISLVIFHGWDENGKGYYCRLSHMEKLARNFKIGDYVAHGEVIGYIGASGTSSQFKPAKEKAPGCHLHFEWHVLSNGEDIPMGFDEHDSSVIKNLYTHIFSKR